jgi:hypothetical protein
MTEENGSQKCFFLASVANKTGTETANSFRDNVDSNGLKQ